MNAAWSAADRDQLWCWASASVPVATAITISSAAPPWRSGCRLNCQPARDAVSLRPRAASRSMARAAAGSSRSVTTVPPASASAGASASTGSMLAVVPLAVVETAEYRRSCQPASTASTTRPRSAPARVAPAIAACLPRRTRAAGAGRSTGKSIAPMASTATTSVAARASSQVAVAVTLMPLALRAAAVRRAVQGAAEQPRQPDARDPAGEGRGRRTAGSPRPRSAVVSCHLVAPRAVSSAVSPSRWVASSRATASSAATVSTSSWSALIASSDLATARLLAVPASTAGRPVLSCRPLSVAEFASELSRAETSAETVFRSVSVKSAMSGWATQVPPLTGSAAGNAAGSTTSGP